MSCIGKCTAHSFRVITLDYFLSEGLLTIATASAHPNGANDPWRDKLAEVAVWPNDRARTTTMECETHPTSMYCPNDRSAHPPKAPAILLKRRHTNLTSAWPGESNRSLRTPPEGQHGPLLKPCGAHQAHERTGQYTRPADTVVGTDANIFRRKRRMAESEGFEPPIALRLCLISSQVHSTGLCQLSDYRQFTAPTPK